MAMAGVWSSFEARRCGGTEKKGQGSDHIPRDLKELGIL